nr:MAG TPA: hypothetical protein [Caudoviricetes sp.]
MFMSSHDTSLLTSLLPLPCKSINQATSSWATYL